MGLKLQGAGEQKREDEEREEGREVKERRDDIIHSGVRNQIYWGKIDRLLRAS